MEAGSAVRSKFQPAFNLRRHCPTVACWPCRGVEVKKPTLAHLWPSDGFAICAVSRHWHSIVGDWTSGSPRNSANRKRLAIFPCQPHAVALLRLPVTINQTHVFPQPLVTTDNAETRDLGLKTRGGCALPEPHARISLGLSGIPNNPSASCEAAGCRASSDRPSLFPAVARLSVSLVVSGQGTMCILLTVADMERARPREAGTE